MVYFWMIPAGIGFVILLAVFYFRIKGRAARAAGDENKSPLDLAKEQEAREEAEAMKRYPTATQENRPA